MSDLARKWYVKGQSRLNSLQKDEDGSQSVEFMGIAAVVIIIIVILTNFFGDDGGGSSGIGNILSGIIELVGGWFR